MKELGQMIKVVIKHWRSHMKEPEKMVKVIMSTLISAWALAGGSLSLVTTGYTSDVPLAKFFFTIFEYSDGSGVAFFFIVLGIGTVFYLVRDRQKNPWVSGISVFFAICTIFGSSYAQTASWDGIFLFGIQLLMAAFVFLGHYFLYKNSILMVIYIFDTHREWLRRSASGPCEKLFFERHPFVAPFVFLLVTGLPWLIAFCPGTLQWDAHAQLWMSMGVIEQTSYHPVFISNYMAGCVNLGRMLFHSDSVGLFFYTFPQFLVQSLTFSYVITVMGRLKSPMIFRWAALLFWGVFPYFQIWGFTMVKDTPYYIAMVLFMAVLTDMLADKTRRWHYILFAVAAGIMALSRNDGRYVIAVSLLALFLCYRKHWRVVVVGLCTCFLLLVVQEAVYMPLHNMAKGPVGEMLSVPLLQTARYLKEHPDDVTEEEREVLQAGFDVELEALRYDPNISDSIKSHFLSNPDRDYLKEYFRVWSAQFWRHPDTYVQAFINKNYGYFYLDCPNYGDYLTVTYIGNSEHWQDGYIDMEFTMKNGVLRDFLRHVVHTVERMPVLSLLYNCGIYTYILLGMILFLLSRKKGKDVCVLVPAVGVLFICLLSPVNGFMRYLMPVMTAWPVGLAWCYYAVHREEELK